MDTKYVPTFGIPFVARQEPIREDYEIESLNERVGGVSKEVDGLARKLVEIEQFFSSSSTKQPCKDRDNLLTSFAKRQENATRKEQAEKRMQELVRQFGTILRQITQHKWAEPFMQPVDVVGLGLHNYYEVIEKPMDFSTIKSRMEAKDGTGYKNVREISADVRLIFKNAMKYNGEKENVHVMAKTLLDKFETKWLQLLPKVDEEERRLKEEEEEKKIDIHLARGPAYAKMARELLLDLDEVDGHLEELREATLQKCRKMTIDEKKRLGRDITQLSPEDINKALDIVARNDPNFEPAAETVVVDMDTQSESTLWKLKFFVKDKLQAQMKSSPTNGGGSNVKVETDQNNLNQRKREICCALAKTSQKKSRRLPT